MIAWKSKLVLLYLIDYEIKNILKFIRNWIGINNNDNFNNNEEDT